MKILLVNKFYYPLGGVESCVFNLEKVLKNKGHNVVTFSMKHTNNESNPYSKYFVSNVDFNKNNKLKSS